MPCRLIVYANTSLALILYTYWQEAKGKDTDDQNEGAELGKWGSHRFKFLACLAKIHINYKTQIIPHGYDTADYC